MGFIMENMTEPLFVLELRLKSTCSFDCGDKTLHKAETDRLVCTVLVHMECDACPCHHRIALMCDVKSTYTFLCVRS